MESKSEDNLFEDDLFGALSPEDALANELDDGRGNLPVLVFWSIETMPTLKRVLSGFLENVCVILGMKMKHKTDIQITNTNRHRTTNEADGLDSDRKMRGTPTMAACRILAMENAT